MGDIGIRHMKEAVEDRVGAVDLDRLVLGKRATHLRREVVPLLRLEVVDDEEATLEQVLAEPLDLGVGRAPETRLGEVGDWKAEELRVIEIEDVAPIEAGSDAADLRDDSWEMPVGLRVVVRPGRATPEASPA